MAHLISVDPTRAYSASFNIGGARCAIAVNRRIPSGQLATELQAAVQGLENTLASIRRGGSVKQCSESTERSIGPFTIGAYDLPNPDLAMVTYSDSGVWSVADRAPNFGPHAVALIVNTDADDWQAGCSPAGIAGALQALAPLLAHE